MGIVHVKIMVFRDACDVCILFLCKDRFMEWKRSVLLDG